MGDYNLETLVGEMVSGDGRGQGRLRQGRDGSEIVSQGHYPLYEQTSRGRLFAVGTALTGTTIVAGNVAPPGAAAATVLSIYNPTGSGFNLEILMGMVLHLSGTPGAGAWAWCAGAASGATAITATPNATPQNMLMGGTVSVASGFTQTALTAGPAHTTRRMFPTAQFAGAIAATTPGQSVVDQVDGGIVVPPGFVLTLAPPAAGTTHIVAAAILFAQVALPT